MQATSFKRNLATGIQLIWTVWIAALLLSACAAAPTRAPLPPLPVLPAESLKQTRSLTQIVHAAFADQQITLQCVVDLTPQRLRVTAVNAMGLRVFTAEVHAGTMAVTRAPGVPASVEPERILADLQFAFWPLAALQAPYTAEGWTLTEPQRDTRRLLRDGQLIAEVHAVSPARDRWRGRLWLSNLHYGYTLSVQPAPSAP